MIKSKFVLLLIFASLLVIPSATHAEKTQVTFWFTENSSEAPGVLALINEFEAQNPDIDIVEQAKGFFSAKETYLTQFSAQLEPTVFRAARDWVIEFAQQGLIQPVTDFMNATDKADFLPDALRMVTYPDTNGTDQIWGWPHLVDGPALFYNKYILEQAGINTTSYNSNTTWTWNEFTANAQKIWDADLTAPSGDRVYGFTMQGMFFGAQPIYYGHGAEFFKNSNVTFDNIDIGSNASRTALTFLKQVVDADYTPPWDLQGWETINEMFKNGQVGFIQQGPWEIKGFLDNAAEFNSEVTDAPAHAGPDNLGIIRLPHDESGNEGAPVGGHAYVISTRASGAVLEAANKFAKFMSSAHAMKAGAIDYYHMPARISVFEDPEVQASDAWKYISTFKEIVDRSYKNPVDPRWAQIETLFGNELDIYLSGTETLDEFIAVVNSFWAEIFNVGVGGNTKPTTIQQAPMNFWVMMFALTALPIIRKWRP